MGPRVEVVVWWGQEWRWWQDGAKNGGGGRMGPSMEVVVGWGQGWRWLLVGAKDGGGGWVGSSMEVVVWWGQGWRWWLGGAKDGGGGWLACGPMPGGIGRMSGDAGTRPEYEVKELMTPDHTAF